MATMSTVMIRSVPNSQSDPGNDQSFIASKRQAEGVRRLLKS
jgi:hypothetical protein